MRRMAKEVPGSSRALIDVLESSSEDEDQLDETPPEFYDPTMDERDQAWADKKRKGRTSDAVLSCPACFTTLCIDCQRHEKFVTQYRAMFVINCKVSERQQIEFSEPRGRGSLKKRKTQHGLADGQMYKSVSCSVCGTEVAAMDKDEVYHFYNVLPSYV